MENPSKVICLMLLKLLTVNTAPMQFPLLQPLPGTWQQQQLALQEQMLALQQFQALQQLNVVPPMMSMNPQQPLLVLLPNAPMKAEKDDHYNKLNENFITKTKPVKEIEDGDADSIIIDAEPDEVPNDTKNIETPMRAILLVPNRARLSIGQFISSIPWLPIEINVPDSISWIYQGISGIISGIGQSWPFNRPQSGENQIENTKTKTIWNDLKEQKIMPIIVMPLAQPALPMRL